MPTDVIIRAYEEGDEAQIVNLLKIGFNGWPKFDLTCSKREHWNWKFLDSPIKKKQITVAEADGEIIGCDHTLYNHVKIGKETYVCGQAVDTAIHPNFRGKGIYSKIRMFDAELDRSESKVSNLVYSASSNPIVIKKEDKIGSSHFPYPIIRWVRIRNIDLHLRKHDLSSRILYKAGYHAAKSVNLIEKLGKRKTVKFDLNDVKVFDERAEQLWKKVRGDYLWGIERGVNYINWRYCDPRGGKYLIKQAEENNEVIGYIVYRINRWDKDYPTGYVVDLCTRPDRLDCAEALIAEAVDYFDKQDVNMLYHIGSQGHPYGARFKRLGFLDSRNNLYAGYHYTQRIKEYDELDKSSLDKIQFHFGDIDCK